MLPSLLRVRVCVCVRAQGVVASCALLGMSHIWAPCNPIPCFTYVNRQTLRSGLIPDSLLGGEWVRHGYQQRALAALVSASPNKGSTHRDINKCIVYTKHGQQINIAPELFFFWQVLYYACKTALEFRGAQRCLSNKHTMTLCVRVCSCGYRPVGL